MCDNFDSMINSEDAAASTSGINFMLVKVLHEGRTICQILEGPGEYYFKPESPHENFPKYVNAIINSNNRKIWAIMVEPAKTNERMNQMARNNYVSKIRQLKTKITPSDKVVFVLNKVDETDFVVGPGNVKLELALKNTDYWYPNIFVPFKNQNPITKLWNPFNFDFCPFQVFFRKILGICQKSPAHLFIVRFPLLPLSSDRALQPDGRRMPCANTRIASISAYVCKNRDNALVEDRHVDIRRIAPKPKQRSLALG